MLISIFKENLFFNSLLLLPYAFLMRLYSLIYPSSVSIQKEGGILYNFILNIFPENSFVLNIISVFILFIEAVMINRIVIKNRFSRDMTLLPGMFFIMLSSLSPEMHGFSPFLIGTFFIILSFGELFKTYKKYKTEKLLFNSGLYMSIATLFYFNFSLLFVPLIFSIFSIRSFKPKEFFQFLSGVLLVIYFYTFGLFWFNKKFIFPQFKFYSITNYFSVDIAKFTIMSITVFILLIIIFTYRKFIIKKSIQSQKKINIVFWLLIFIIITIVFHNPKFMMQYQIAIAFPLSVFTSMIFLRIKNNLIAEIVNLIIVFAILIYHFQFYSLF